VIVGNAEQLKTEFATDKFQLVPNPGSEKGKAAEQLAPKKTTPENKTAAPPNTPAANKTSGAATKPD
jgi:hypothetical protein